MNAALSAIDTRLHPLAAIRAVRALQRNPEDTSQIFMIFRALRGKTGMRLFARFQASATGQKILAEQRSLLTVLTNRAALSAMPSGSIGRAYAAFMDREQLTADGLVIASEADEVAPSPELALFRMRMRDAHDLTHILTGYGRDALGELCLLAFMNRHTRNPGQLLIIAMSWLRMSAKGRAAVREAYHNGGKARWLVDQDYEALLARPLDAVRHELLIATPWLYRELLS